MSAYSKKLGICVKDSELTVLSQNDRCIDTCGSQVGNKCDFGCVHEIEKLDVLTSELNGFNIFKSLMVDDQVLDANILKTDDEIVTFLYPVENNRLSLKEKLAQYKLTNREFEIFELVMKKVKNKEIAAKLYISLATVRTHMNNIYKKIPLQLHRSLLR